MIKIRIALFYKVIFSADKVLIKISRAKVLPIKAMRSKTKCIIEFAKLTYQENLKSNVLGGIFQKINYFFNGQFLRQHKIFYA